MANYVMVIPCIKPGLSFGSPTSCTTAHIHMDYLVEKIENRDKANDERRTQAARQIQRLWRSRNAAKSRHISADQRWQDAATHAKLKVSWTGPLKGPARRLHSFFAASTHGSRARQKREPRTMETISIPRKQTTGWQQNFEQTWFTRFGRVSKIPWDSALAGACRRVSGNFLWLCRSH